TYRHCFWDDGTLLANLLAVAAAVDLPARVVLGFVDDELNRLLDLDTAREVTLGLLALGRGGPPPPPAPPAPPLGLTTLPLSPREVDYPAIRRAPGSRPSCGHRRAASRPTGGRVPTSTSS